MSRLFVRHPSSIPIHVNLEEVVDDCNYLRDVSLGGLCFVANTAIDEGAIIQIHIPIVHPRFSARARVAWSKPRAQGEGFDTGVEFLNTDTAFRARMVEQVCHIEEYKAKILRDEARTLNSEEAALEWIRKHAAEFPPFQSALEGEQ